MTIDRDAALKELAELKARVDMLERIINAPDKPEGLWVPEEGAEYWFITGLSEIDVQIDTHGGVYSTRCIRRYNAFPAKEIALRAAAMQADANLLIAAALQADPEAGPRSHERPYSVELWTAGGLYVPHLQTGWSSVACVHTATQAAEMARLINEELKKRKQKD